MLHNVYIFLLGCHEVVEGDSIIRGGGTNG